MAIKKITIPVRAQMPAAIALALMLIVLLAYKSGHIQPGAWFSFGDTAEIQLEEVSLDEMMILISDASGSITDAEHQERPMPELIRNPFQRPDFAETMRSPNASIRGGSGQRAETLIKMELLATLQMGGFAAALVDGKYVREGDIYNGFEVVSIREREITLKDDRGLETLRMPEESLL
ncbi:MAG: hypothetical protein COA73_13105 [Candidatus Hydrogenedentota bacterium]|nr:MAG: hypothetical protein COA73_13105 [Candidatus Hydrogenedentota bacterium]